VPRPAGAAGAHQGCPRRLVPARARSCTSSLGQRCPHIRSLVRSCTGAAYRIGHGLPEPDRDVSPMHLGALATFRPVRLGGPGRVAALLARRAQRLPQLRRRVQPPWFPLAAASWEDDLEFCAKDHIHVHYLGCHSSLDLAASLAAEGFPDSTTSSRPGLGCRTFLVPRPRLRGLEHRSGRSAGRATARRGYPAGGKWAGQPKRVNDSAPGGTSGECR
jgi:hypothetical protein